MIRFRLPPRIICLTKDLTYLDLLECRIVMGLWIVFVGILI